MCFSRAESEWKPPELQCVTGSAGVPDVAGGHWKEKTQHSNTSSGEWGVSC